MLFQNVKYKQKVTRKNKETKQKETVMLDKDLDSYYIYLEHDNFLKILNKLKDDKKIDWGQLRVQQNANLKTSYKEKIKDVVRPSVIEGFSFALEWTKDDKKLDDFFERLDEAMYNKINQYADPKYLNELYDIVDKTDINKCLKDFVNDEKVEQQLENLQKIFDYIYKCLHTLHTRDSNTLAAILINSLNNKNNYKEVGEQLSLELETWKSKHQQPETFKGQTIDRIYDQLNNLAYVLEHDKFKTSGNKITSNGLLTLIQNGIISTEIAEPLAFLASAKAKKSLNNSIKRSGYKTTETDLGLNKIVGKADNKFENLKLEMEIADGEKAILRLETVGISNKFYKHALFDDSGNIVGGTIGSGSAGSLKDALYDIFDNKVHLLFYAYNFLAFQEKGEEENVRQLHDILTRYSFIKAWMSAGKTDMSNYLYVNNKMVSLYKILNLVLGKDSKFLYSRSSSNKIEEKDANTAGLYISLPGRHQINNEKIGKGRNMEKAWERSALVNSTINTIKIYQHFHLKQLVEALPEDKGNNNLTT